MDSRLPTERCVSVWYTNPPLLMALYTCGSKNNRTGIQPSQVVVLRGLFAILVCLKNLIRRQHTFYYEWGIYENVDTENLVSEEHCCVKVTQQRDGIILLGRMLFSQGGYR